MSDRIKQPFERDDVEFAVFMVPIEGDGGESFRVGRGGVTAIKIAARPGPMDWLPYVEVWQGDHLHVEVAQHQIGWVEYLPAVERNATEAEAERACASLKTAIDAAQNGNQAGENAVVRAAAVL